MDHIINGAYSFEILANEGFGVLPDTKHIFQQHKESAIIAQEGLSRQQITVHVP